jgi:hypothetical protein
MLLFALVICCIRTLCLLRISVNWVLFAHTLAYGRPVTYMYIYRTFKALTSSIHTVLEAVLEAALDLQHALDT